MLILYHRQHDDYKRHITNLINIKSAVDNKAPSKFTHLRQKNYKEEFFKKREIII